MPGEGFAVVAIRDGKIEDVVEGRIQAFVGHRPSPFRLVVGPCDLISENEGGKRRLERRNLEVLPETGSRRNWEGKLTIENDEWTTLGVSGLVVLVQGYCGVGEVGLPLGEDVDADSVIDVIGIVLGRSCCPWLEKLACLEGYRQDGQD